MTISEIATEDVVTVDPDTEVPAIVAEMAENEVGTVVIAEGDEPVSIVSDRKIAMAIDETEDVGELRADDVMTEDLVTVREDDGVFEVIQTMSDAAIRRIPVVDDQGALVGIISLDDVIVLLSTELGNASDVIQEQAGRL